MTTIEAPVRRTATEVNDGGEYVPPGEANAIRVITEVSLQLLDTTTKPVLRGQHPKQSGTVRADLIVDPKLPADLRVGVFAEPRTHPAVVRFSNGRRFDDRKGDAHGVAIKLLDVDGEKILDAERDARTHDFILLDNPVFFFKDAEEYSVFCHATMGAMWRVRIDPLARSFTRISELVMAGALFVRFFWKRLREMHTIRDVGSKRPDSPLESSYFSTTPYRLGPHVVRYALRPHREMLAKTNASKDADQLRNAMSAQLSAGDAAFDLMVQLQTDPENMPVEDPRQSWNEGMSPLRRIATLRIPKQNFATPERLAFGERLSFTPWHALPEHRPLGGINRTRRAVYETLSKRRHELNGVASSEPTVEEVAALWRDA